MALNATMYRFAVELSDLNRNIYESLSLHVALHPSETIERMCLRVLAYSLFYEEGLVFTKGLSDDAEPDLWCIDYSGDIQHWIELGTPDAKRLKKGMGRSRKVSVLTYEGQESDKWIESVTRDLNLNNKLQIVRVDREQIQPLVESVERGMQMNVMIQDNEAHLSFADVFINLQIDKVMGE